MAIREQIEEIVAAAGVDCFGYADLTREAAGLQREYGEVWQDYPCAVSLLMRIPLAVCEEMRAADVPTPSYTYYYDVLNDRLNQAALRVSAALEDGGYRAYPIPASQRTGDDRLAAVFSHRHAARLAGLGYIGKSCCLINPQFGPRHRLATVLTDAPLPCGEPLAVDCGACRICMNECPAQAVRGVNFQPDQPLEQRLDAAACDNFLSEARRAIGKRFCGRCVVVCPVGRARPEPQRLIFLLGDERAERVIEEGGRYRIVRGLSALQGGSRLRLWDDQLPEEGLREDDAFCAVPPEKAAAIEAYLEKAEAVYRIIGRLY